MQYNIYDEKSSSALMVSTYMEDRSRVRHRCHERLAALHERAANHQHKELHEVVHVVCDGRSKDSSCRTTSSLCVIQQFQRLFLGAYVALVVLAPWCTVMITSKEHANAK
jgi:hypothetical protein